MKQFWQFLQGCVVVTAAGRAELTCITRNSNILISIASTFPCDVARRPLEIKYFVQFQLISLFYLFHRNQFAGILHIQYQ